MLPYMSLRLYDSEAIYKLKKCGVILSGYSYLEPQVPYRLPLSEIIGDLILSKTVRFRFYLPKRIADSVDFVLSFHETYNSVLTAYLLAKKLNIKIGAILQLPPFYGDRDRARNVRKARAMWLRLVHGIRGKFTNYIYDIADNILERRIRKMLREFDMLIAVSKSIPYEMGTTFSGKLYVLDPGVALDRRDLELMDEIRRRKPVKKDIVVFTGGSRWSKGLLEALMAWRTIVRHRPDLKLYITGRVEPKTLARIGRLLKRMGVENTVVFTGYLPRDRLFELIAQAKVLLYPSHVDAYPFTVLEALCLGTPVVGYDIPALRLNFSHVAGVKLVKEFDIEALATETLNVIEKGYETECPQCKTWDEVMAEEIEIVKRALCE